MWQVLRNLTFWGIAPLAAISQGTNLAIHGLWIKPWLRDVVGINQETASNVTAQQGFTRLKRRLDKASKQLENIKEIKAELGKKAEYKYIQIDPFFRKKNFGINVIYK